MQAKHLLALPALVLLAAACQPEQPPVYDLVIRNAVIYDGSGASPFRGDLAVNADTIAVISDHLEDSGAEEIDAQGMALSPGFINMLSWASGTLGRDGRAMSDIKQGVTLEVMGEGNSLGPVAEPRELGGQSVRTLGEHLAALEQNGVSPNIASFVGATSVRVHELDYEDRPPTPWELDRMRDLVREAMEEGALGVGSSLIYAPAFYADTEELIELCKVAAEYSGMYITHMRSEGNRFLEAIDEVIRIASEAGIRAEIYHLKAGGQTNWPKMDLAIAKIDSARAAGLAITTDMYNYTAGATGLNAAMPPSIQEGGYGEWRRRLMDPNRRQEIITAMRSNPDDWENLYYHATPEGVLLTSFRNDSLGALYTGKTVAEAAEMMGLSPEEAAIELVIHDSSRVGVVYFLMSEENVKKQIALPYMSFGSDAGAPAAEGDWLKSSTHPRTYGNFARLLGKYVRDEQVITLEEAVRKLAALPAENLRIEKRGRLQPGYFADLVLFDPATIQDHATYDQPHQYSTGVVHVWVNGTQVLKDGEHTGATPGRFIKGPGAKR